MYLNRTDIKENKQEWLNKGYNLPTFDYETIKKNTLENPVWIHFGAGNIFRAFQCVSVQKLLNENLMDTGLIALGEETYKEMCDAHDNLSITVTLKSDGSIDKTVVGSIAEALNIDELDDNTLNTLVDFFKKDSLQMCSFTITYKCRNIKVKNIPIISILSPVVSNGLIIGAELAYMYSSGNFLLDLAIYGGEVALGELIATVCLYPLLKAIVKNVEFDKYN